jgi:hypothetical protein
MLQAGWGEVLLMREGFLLQGLKPGELFAAGVYGLKPVPFKTPFRFY